MKIFYLSILIILVTTFSSCVTTPDHTETIAKNEPAELTTKYMQFQKFCNANDRSIIYEQVYVDGFLIAYSSGTFCRDAWNPIVFGNYKYIECSTSKVRGTDMSTWEGLYRFSVEVEGHPDCDYNDELLQESQRGYYQKHKDRLVGKCLAAKQINVPMSNYLLLYEIGYIDSDEQHNTNYAEDYKELQYKKELISYWGNRIIDMETDRVLSIDRNYTFYPKSLIYEFTKKYECENAKHINIENVLIPNGN